jgi:hypothetical protein
MASYSQWMTPDAIVIYPSWKRSLLPLLLCGGFVAIGLFLLATPARDDKLAGIACIVFFGGAMIYPLARLIRKVPSLIIHSSGIFENGSALASGFLTWEEIASVKSTLIGKQRYLAISVKDTEVFLRRQPGLKRFIMKMNRKWFGAAIYISELNLSMPLNEVIATIQEKQMAARTWLPAQ